jgi:hypothetical protein
MDPEKLLRSMCERHGLPSDYGTQLLPLIQRALEAPEEVRDRILTLIDGNLAQCARNGVQAGKLFDNLDREVLIAVARVLHHWTPSEPMLDLGSQQGRLDLPGAQ